MGNKRVFVKTLTILLAVVLLSAMLPAAAFAAPSTPKSNGSFIVELWNGSAYVQAASFSTDEFQSEFSANIGSVTNPRLRIRKAAEGLAFLDSVLLDGRAVSGNKKLLKTDFDVQEITTAGVVLQFTGKFNGSLSLTGRIEPKVIIGNPLMFPFDNTFIDDPQDFNAFFTYELDSNTRVVNVDGRFEDMGKAFESRFLVSSTGHPDGYAYIYVSNDDKYLYASADFTGDNTFDYGEDFFKVFANVGRVVKEFKQTSGGREYGAAAMQYTDKVAHEHMYYETKIPLGEFGGQNKLQLAFSLYGTFAISDVVSNPASLSFTAGDTANGILRIRSYIIGSGSLTGINYDATGLSVQYQISPLPAVSGDGYYDIPYTVQCATPGSYDINIAQLMIDDNPINIPLLDIPVQVNAVPVSITTQPASITVAAGQGGVLSVEAGGTEPLSYQWELSIDGGASWNVITGETSDTLTLSDIELECNGFQYRCVVDNAANAPVTSAAATLQVVPPITGLPDSYTMYTDGRAIWNPQPSGGTWDYDETFFSATFNGSATFRALRAGTSTITYSVSGISESVIVTIRDSGLPSTGQDLTLVYVLVGIAACALGTAIWLSVYRRRLRA